MGSKTRQALQNIDLDFLFCFSRHTDVTIVWKELQNRMSQVSRKLKSSKKNLRRQDKTKKKMMEKRSNHVFFTIRSFLPF